MVYEEEGILDAVSKRNYQRTSLHFIVSSVDSDEAGLLELLEGDDLEDFFFGVPVVVETKEQNERRKRPPIKTVKHTIDDKYKFSMRIYQSETMLCAVCRKACRDGDLCKGCSSRGIEAPK